MKPIHSFNVKPSLPKKLEPLRELAYNIHWDWSVEAKNLFQRLDRDLWSSSRHNPVLMLGTISQERLNEVAEDDGFLAQMDRAVQALNNYLESRVWYGQARGKDHPQECFAYFCAEFGLSYCLHLYSGGLGILAGDHLKSASDLGLPLVGVGLLYQEGYFSQYLNADGWQQEYYPINDFYNMPIILEHDTNGKEIIIEVEYPGRTIYARVWRVQVGTIPLYLLDTNIEQNKNPYDHDLTDRLYGGDLDMRLQQEMMLGIGGIRMLKALGYKPTVFHLNEGHSAFLILERIRQFITEDGLNFKEAKQLALSTQVFTTHTPVSAGFDLFPPDKMMHYMGHYAHIFNLGQEEFLGLGRENTGDFSSPFSMAALALKTASHINGVSLLHGEVSRKMFHGMWKDFPEKEVPITSVTNGVHARSVVSPETQELYDRYLGPSWDHRGAKDPIWKKVANIPDEELWRNHELRRAELVVFVRQKLADELERQGARDTDINKVNDILNPSVFTIGFARRFATYKRANLLLRDLKRFKQLLVGNKNRQVQFIVAGKAHPKDIPGKELIRYIIHTMREEGLSDHVIFLPNYNVHIARKMVAGCDIWLNTPRRPREASGTSGMKAAMNGLPNVSILDGWWDEADYKQTGWAIGSGEEYDDLEYQDEVEANFLYDLLEKEVIPLFYTRDELGLPRGWLSKMKNAIRFNCPKFNTARMVRDYANRFYFPTSDRFSKLTSNNYTPVKELSQWKHKLFEQWYHVRIHSVDVSQRKELEVNQTVNVTAKINLAGLTFKDVKVELYMGKLDDKGDIVNGYALGMTYQGTQDGNISIYQTDIHYSVSGLQGLSLRILPDHPHLASPSEPGLILWA